MNKLWDKNFILITSASALGSLGAIASSFALSYLVFDETGSTLASALIISIQLIPYVILPLAISPIMDRLPRKKFLVFGDLCNGLVYLLLALYLLNFSFSYITYLIISLILACLGSIDELAFDSIYPSLVSKDSNQKGYAVLTMLYPMMKIIMTPLSAILMEKFGIPTLLFIQTGCSFLASFIENNIELSEDNKFKVNDYSFKEWKDDIHGGYIYLKSEKGLLNMFMFTAISNGISTGYAPILIAFFTTTSGFTLTMYSFFSVFEFVGRTIASTVQYKINISNDKKYFIVTLANLIYGILDSILLFLSYPLMLFNRLLCGFIGTNSAIIRTASFQQYIPEKLRSRINAFNNILYTAISSILSLFIGLLGEIINYKYCMLLAGVLTIVASLFILVAKRKDIELIYKNSSN